MSKEIVPEKGSYEYLDYITKKHDKAKESMNVSPEPAIKKMDSKIVVNKPKLTKLDDYVTQEKKRRKIMSGGLGSVFSSLME